MTEKERMLNGELYLDTDPELLMLLGKSQKAGNDASPLFEKCRQKCVHQPAVLL